MDAILAQIKPCEFRKFNLRMSEELINEYVDLFRYISKWYLLHMEKIVELNKQDPNILHLFLLGMLRQNKLFYNEILGQTIIPKEIVRKINIFGSEHLPESLRLSVLRITPEPVLPEVAPVPISESPVHHTSYEKSCPCEASIPISSSSPVVGLTDERYSTLVNLMETMIDLVKIGKKRKRKVQEPAEV